MTGGSLAAPSTSPEAKPAPAKERIWSYLLDLAVFVILLAVIWVWTRSWFLGLIAVLELGVVVTIWRARTGRTFGALATQTVATNGYGAAPGLRRQAIHSVIFGALHLSLVGPLVTLLLSQDGRDWVERFAGITVVDLRERRNLPVARDAYGRQTSQASSWQGYDTSTSLLAGAPVAPVPTPEQAATPTPDPAPAPEPKLSPAQEPTAAPNFEPAPDPTQKILLVVDSGQQIPLTGEVVLGRAPGSSDDETELSVPILDTTRSLSRTHLRVGIDEAGVWAEDAFSANGTQVESADGQLTWLERGKRHHIQIGSTLRMGERSISVQGG